MKRKKNLERAIVLGLLLSTSVYGTAWAEEPITDQNHTNYVDGKYDNDVIIENTIETEAAIKLENEKNVNINLNTPDKYSII